MAGHLDRQSLIYTNQLLKEQRDDRLREGWATMKKIWRD